MQLLFQGKQRLGSTHFLETYNFTNSLSAVFMWELLLLSERENFIFLGQSWLLSFKWRTFLKLEQEEATVLRCFQKMAVGNFGNFKVKLLLEFAFRKVSAHQIVNPRVNSYISIFVEFFFYNFLTKNITEWLRLNHVPWGFRVSITTWIVPEIWTIWSKSQGPKFKMCLLGNFV